MIIVSSEQKQFDTNEIKRGTLIYAKHKSWAEGIKGFVTFAGNNEVIVQYPPVIGNVTNHFFVRANEAAAGDWKIVYTNDMENLEHYEGEANDTETTD